MSGNRDKINSVFYADSYHPIQSGSIDGTDILPHDNAVYRAHLCSLAGLYDPFGDPKVIGDPYCTVFVGHLSHLTTEETLHKAMSKYGNVKNLRLVRHIVTGASRGYAFVEYETEREMRRAYEDAHHSRIDDSEVIVDYNRQQLMPGWIPRRLGGGLGGRKESGQLRFGGRERPFRAPLRPIPYDDLKRLGIPPPPEGRYMSRYQVPSPPRRESSSVKDRSHKSSKQSKHSHRQERRSTSRERSTDGRNFVDREDWSHKSRKQSTHSHRHVRRSTSRDRSTDGRSSTDRQDWSHKSYKQSKHSDQNKRRSTSCERSTDGRSLVDREDRSHKSHKRSKHSHQRERRSTSRDRSTDGRNSVDTENRSHKHYKHRSKHSYGHETWDSGSLI